MADPEPNARTTPFTINQIYELLKDDFHTLDHQNQQQTRREDELNIIGTRAAKQAEQAKEDAIKILQREYAVAKREEAMDAKEAKYNTIKHEYRKLTRKYNHLKEENKGHASKGDVVHNHRAKLDELEQMNNAQCSLGPATPTKKSINSTQYGVVGLSQATRGTSDHLDNSPGSEDAAAQAGSEIANATTPVTAVREKRFTDLRQRTPVRGVQMTWEMLSQSPTGPSSISTSSSKTTVARYPTTSPGPEHRGRTRREETHGAALPDAFDTMQLDALSIRATTSSSRSSSNDSFTTALAATSSGSPDGVMNRTEYKPESAASQHNTADSGVSPGLAKTDGYRSGAARKIEKSQQPESFVSREAIGLMAKDNKKGEAAKPANINCSRMTAAALDARDGQYRNAEFVPNLTFSFGNNTPQPTKYSTRSSPNANISSSQSGSGPLTKSRIPIAEGRSSPALSSSGSDFSTTAQLGASPPTIATGPPVPKHNYIPTGSSDNSSRSSRKIKIPTLIKDDMKKKYEAREDLR